MKNTFTKLFLALFITFTALFPHSASAASTKRYVAVVLLNKSNFSVEYMIVADQQSSNKTVAKEYGGSQYGSTKYFADSVAEIREFGQPGANGNAIYLSFPGTIGNLDATSRDKTQARGVIGDLVSSINSALSFIKSEADLDISEANILEEAITKIAESIPGERVIEKTFSFTGGKSTFTITALSEADKKEVTPNDPYTDYRMGLDSSCYLKIKSSTSGREAIFLWRMPKGYASGQYIDSMEPGRLDSSDKWLTWYGMLHYSMIAASQGITADNSGFEQFENLNPIQEGMKTLMSYLSDLLISFTGSDQLEDIILNRNNHAYSYYLGLMPQSWWDVSSTLFWVMFVIAVLVLFGSVTHILFKYGQSLVSPTERVSIQDRILNIFKSVVLMGLYVPLFYVLGKTNAMLIEVLNGLVSGYSLTSAVMHQNAGTWLIGVILACTSSVMIVRINIEFFIRSLEIALLHVIAPVAVSSIAINGKQGVFSTWLRELIALIFMQLFDAIVLTLYLLLLKHHGLATWFEGLLLIYSFIPINRWFKNNVAGLRGAGTDSAAMAVQNAWDNAKNRAVQTAALATGAAISGIGSLKDENAKRSTTDAHVETKINENTNVSVSSQGGDSADAGPSKDQGSFGNASAQSDSAPAPTVSTSSDNDAAELAGQTLDAIQDAEGPADNSAPVDSDGSPGASGKLSPKTKKSKTDKTGYGKVFAGALAGGAAYAATGNSSLASAISNRGVKSAMNTVMANHPEWDDAAQKKFQAYDKQQFSRPWTESEVNQKGPLYPVYKTEAEGYTLDASQAAMGKDSFQYAQLGGSNLMFAETGQIDGMNLDTLRDADGNTHYGIFFTEMEMGDYQQVNTQKGAYFERLPASSSNAAIPSVAVEKQKAQTLFNYRQRIDKAHQGVIANIGKANAKGSNEYYEQKAAADAYYSAQVAAANERYHKR